MYTIKIKRKSTEILLPKYETVGASGMDIRAYKYSLPEQLDKETDFPEDGFVLKPHERVLVRTGLNIQIPKDTEIQVRPRSGLALKYGITLANAVGTLDEDYRGDIGVILLNTSNKDFIIKKGDRIAQIILMPVLKFEWDVVKDLSETKRGEGGFNSTGVK
jgi:dUTP pyrophosphatase